MLIGLMGKSGSGKTTVSNLFKELNGEIQVLDVDKIGHDSHKDEEVKKQLFKDFGKCIFNVDFSVNRKKLSDIVFNDAEMMQKLCKATYDFMQREIDKRIAQSNITILDYALLPKTKYYDMCDVKILIEAPYSKRSNRVVKRDGISNDKYDEIDHNSLDYSNLQFDYVIENNFNTEYLRKVIGDIYEKSVVSR